MLKLLAYTRALKHEVPDQKLIRISGTLSTILNQAEDEHRDLTWLAQL